MNRPSGNLAFPLDRLPSILSVYDDFSEAPLMGVFADLLNVILILLSLFLILIVLIQRGKGGGLIGALGGSGGSSPFGSRAGDQFTRVTIYVALVWLLLIMIQVRIIQDTQTGPAVSIFTN